MIELFILIIVIGVCSEAFTRTLDEIGDNLGFDQHQIGSVFAAIATTLPETLVPLVALTVHHNTKVALGATFGSFLVLSTLALPIVGVVLRVKQGKYAAIQPSEALVKDFVWFIGFCLVGLLLSRLHADHMLQILGAVFLLGSYAKRLRGVLKRNQNEPAEKESYKKNSNNRMLYLRMCLILIALGLASSYFVDALHKAPPILGNELVMALVLSPLATELPEKVNSILWVLRGREIAAIGNISGALVYQASVLTAINILMGSWVINSTMTMALMASMLAATNLVLQKRRWSWILLAGQSVWLVLFWILQGFIPHS